MNALCGATYLTVEDQRHLLIATGRTRFYFDIYVESIHYSPSCGRPVYPGSTAVAVRHGELRLRPDGGGCPNPVVKLTRMSNMARRKSEPREPRTRGGHLPTGTAAERRTRTASPSTPKSAQTRQSLIDAAEAVFITNGYLDARVSDIVQKADVAHGSFYTYFSSKRAIFQAVVDQVAELIKDAVSSHDDDVPGDYVGNLKRANRRYLQVHRENAAILMLVEQVATADPEIHKSRVEARHAHVDRIERTIRRLQERGLAEQSLDPHTTAGALVSMLSSFAHWSTVEPGEYEAEQVTRTLTEIWTRALGLSNIKP